MSANNSPSLVLSGKSRDEDYIFDSILESSPKEVASTSYDLPESSSSQGRMRRFPTLDFSDLVVPQRGAWDYSPRLISSSISGYDVDRYPSRYLMPNEFGVFLPVDKEPIVHSSDTRLGVYQDHL